MIQTVPQTTIDLFNAGYRQVARLTFYGQDTELEITDANIVMGSLSVDRYSVSGEQIEIGSAIAAQLDFQLDNRGRTYDGVRFEGGEIFCEIGTKNWKNDEDPITWVPMGYFLVDVPPRHLSTISISALDRMVLFNRTVAIGEEAFPMTVEQLVNRCCSDCNVTSQVDFTALVNTQYTIDHLPEITSEDELTYRTIIQWCAQILGGCAYMDWDGHLRIGWYESEPSVTITPSVRYLAGDNDIYENAIHITGLEYTEQDEDGSTTLIGTEEYALDLSENMLIQSGASDVLSEMFTAVGGFSYTQFQSKIKPAPYLWAMDTITYIDRDGNEIITSLTNANHKLNGASMIAAKGETTQTHSYAGNNGLTRQQSKVVEKLVGQSVDVRLTEAQRANIDLNQMLANSLGLYMVQQETDSGTIFYYCNQPTLEASNIIYTFTANGLAWTDHWNSGDPIWTYGITRDGNAVLHAISAYTIVADVIKGGTLTLGYQDNQAGKMEVYDEANNLVAKVDKDGFMSATADEGYVVMNATDGFAGYDRNGTKIYWAAAQEFHMRNAQVEYDFTLAQTMRYIPIQTSTNRGVGLVPYVEGVS